MSSTYSPSFRTELPATGDQNNTWAATVNNNWNVPIELGISGALIIALPDANYTLSVANAAPDESGRAVLIFTGALTAQRTITAPLVPKTYIVRNNTTGGQNILLRGGTGTFAATTSGIPQAPGAAPYSGEATSSGLRVPGVIIPPNSTTYVVCDGVSFTYCVNALAGDVAAESVVLPSPLAIPSGGTAATTAADARSNLGLGSAATFAASVGNTPNTIPLRDGFGDFSAGTITAGLNGTASTSSNTSLFANLPPPSFATVGTSWQMVSLGYLGVVGPNSVDIYNAFGMGMYMIEVSGGIGPEFRLKPFWCFPDGTLIDAFQAGGAIGQHVRASGTSSFILGNIYKFAKLY